MPLDDNRLQGFVADLLRHEDALVEPIEPDGLEVLAPPEVQRAFANSRGEFSPLKDSPRRLPIRSPLCSRFHSIDWDARPAAQDLA